MKRVKKPYISLATVDGKAVRKIKEIDIKVKEERKKNNHNLIKLESK